MTFFACTLKMLESLFTFILNIPEGKKKISTQTEMLICKLSAQIKVLLDLFFMFKTVADKFSFHSEVTFLSPF